MNEATWYLGPLNDLRPLLCPEVDVTVNPIRFGGVHQALTGAATVDYTGTKMEYGLAFRYLDPETFDWLDVLNSRLVPGPFYLVDPLKNNRLSMDSLGMKVGVTDPESVTYWRHSFTLGVDNVVGKHLRTVTIEDTTNGYPWRVAPGPVPVQPGETITASVYAKADLAFTCDVGMDFFSGPWTRADPGNASRRVEVGQNWQRIHYTAVVPPGVHGVRLYVLPRGTGRDLTLTAPQVELRPSPGPWETGGGGIQVAMTDLRATSPRYPYRDAELTLLEA